MLGPDINLTDMIIYGGIVFVLAVFLYSFIVGVARSINKARHRNEKEGKAESKKTATTPVTKTSKPIQQSSKTGMNIFISYRRDDSADITGRIYDRLIQHFSQEAIFKDVDSIPLGVDFREHIEQYVGRCQVLLAVIGPSWVDIVDQEGRRRLDTLRDLCISR